MTPRTVMFSLPENTSVETYYRNNKDSGFSRIPIYRDDPDQVVGFVLRQELLREQASGHGTKLLKDLMRKLPVLSEMMVLTRAFDEIVRSRTHVSLVVDEYGSPEGILTLEDILETLLGFEIIDEGDEATDMQVYARQLWERRASKLGIELKQLEEQADLTDKK